MSRILRGRGRNEGIKAVLGVALTFLVIIGATGVVVAHSPGADSRPNEPSASGQMTAPATATATHDTLPSPWVYPVRYPLHVLVAGDSISQGWSAKSTEDTFVARLRAALERDGPADVDVIGHPGYTSEQVTPLVPKQAYDLVIIELGTNDANRRDPGWFRQNYEKLIWTARKASPRAVLVCAGAWQDDYLASIVDPIIHQTCTTHSGKFVPLNGLFKSPSMRASAPDQPVIGAADDFHPNSDGHAAIAKLILASLRR